MKGEYKMTETKLTTIENNQTPIENGMTASKQ